MLLYSLLAVTAVVAYDEMRYQAANAAPELEAGCWMVEKGRCPMRSLLQRDLPSNLTYEQCKAACLNDAECTGTSGSDNICNLWKLACHASSMSNNEINVAVKQCPSGTGLKHGQGAIWCRWAGQSAYAVNCLWGSQVEQQSHNCKATGCSPGQCCYDTYDEAFTECEASTACKGFWHYPGDGFYYVRGTGEGGHIDPINYSTSKYWMKEEYMPQPVCNPFHSHTSGIAFGCENHVCLDGNNFFPTEETARRRCAQVAGCQYVMKWVDNFYYLRRATDPRTSAYPAASYLEVGCEGNEDLED